MSRTISQTKQAPLIDRQPIGGTSTLSESEPLWLKQARNVAQEAYQKLPMPLSNSDDWRHIEIGSLDLSSLHPVGNDAWISVGESDLPKWLAVYLQHVGSHSGIVAQFGDKQVVVSPNISSDTKSGIVFCPIQDAIEKHESLIKPYFEKNTQIWHQDKLAQMNQASFNGGMFLYVPANCEIADPFISLMCATAAFLPRCIIVCAANSKVNLVNCFGSTNHSASSASFFNGSVEIYLDQGANLSYVELHNFESSTLSITRSLSRLEKDSSLLSFVIGLNGAQLKSDIVTCLSESGASSHINGIILGDGKEHFNFNTIQEHSAPDTKSNIVFKVALNGEATSIYQGTIQVTKDAQKTDAYQSNKNLLLSRDARADSIPKLEILADDVKCSHGATVGPVDQEQIFYLTSRGLSIREAEELIMIGFFRQVFDALSIPGVSAWVNDLITAKINCKIG